MVAWGAGRGSRSRRPSAWGSVDWARWSGDGTGTGSPAGMTRPSRARRPCWAYQVSRLLDTTRLGTSSPVARTPQPSTDRMTEDSPRYGGEIPHGRARTRPQQGSLDRRDDPVGRLVPDLLVRRGRELAPCHRGHRPGIRRRRCRQGPGHGRFRSDQAITVKPNHGYSLIAPWGRFGPA